MVDLDFERRVNPWLFDSSGNLTEEAKRQFPDLAAGAAGVQPPGWSPDPVVGAGGAVAAVHVSPEALRRAAVNADALHTKFGQACHGAFKDMVAATEDMSRSWAIVEAIWNAHSVWSGQVNATEKLIGDVATALAGNAEQYARAEQANAQNFRTG